MRWDVYFLIAVLFVSVVVSLIYYFVVHNNKKKDFLNDDKQLIEQIVSVLDLLKSIASNNDEINQKLDDLQQEIRYSPPVNNKNIYYFDEKILTRINDLKIALTRAKANESYYLCDKMIMELCLLVAERNSKI